MMKRNGLDRVENGRFATGNEGGPGRPRRPVEETYLLAISQACPPEAWQRVVAKAVDDAQAGDAKAREWLSRYLVREPDGSAPRLLVAHLHAMQDIDPVSKAYAERQIPDRLSLLMDSPFDDERASKVRELARKLE